MCPLQSPDAALEAEPQPASGVDLSIVVPVYDEEDSLPQLQGEITAALAGGWGGTLQRYEVVYVDDRSRDGSFAVLRTLREQDGRVRVVRLARNCGQSAAMAAGFQVSRGAVVVALDADLQNDPADIPRLLAELNSGYDLVVGWRKDRKDGWILRRLPSIIANRMISRITGSMVHDTGCTLKAFRRELVENLPIYADQHRFLPVLAKASGARIGELVVNHRPRLFGESKYGISRALRVLVDLLTIKMVSSFSRSPLQYFALLATPFICAAGVFGLRTMLQWGEVSFDNNWGQATLLVFMLVLMAGAFFLLLGLLAELVVKTSGLHGGRQFAPLQAFGQVGGEE